MISAMLKWKHMFGSYPFAGAPLGGLLLGVTSREPIYRGRGTVLRANGLATEIRPSAAQNAGNTILTTKAKSTILKP